VTTNNERGESSEIIAGDVVKTYHIKLFYCLPLSEQRFFYALDIYLWTAFFMLRKVVVMKMTPETN